MHYISDIKDNNKLINEFLTEQIILAKYENHQISQQTKDKAEAFRLYIERKYSKRKQEEQQKKANWEHLQQKMNILNYSASEQENLKKQLLQKEAEYFRKKRKKLTVKDFEPLAIIGRGAFGEIRICRWKETSEVVAMKKMNKSEMVYKNQVQHVRAERDVLAAATNPWIVELKCSFQDEKNLYLVMEYLPGGDLMNLLIKKEILNEQEAKFYIAEAILAVESVHKLNYIHRDLKPDNILLDANGHIKLSDFGLCKHADIRPKKFEIRKNDVNNDDDDIPNDPILTKSNLAKRQHGYRRNRYLAYSTVGTPDYIAPEVFSQNGYTETVDWWSLGVILYEMLIGYPAFSSDDPNMTCQKIINWKKTFHIPSDANLSPSAADLIRRLIADPNERLGINGVEEIKAHPFFAGIDWKRIREKKAYNVPELSSEIDTRYFDNFTEEKPWIEENEAKVVKKGRKDINFIGYTFKREFEAQRSLLVAALIELESAKAFNASISNEKQYQQQQQYINLQQFHDSNHIINIKQKENEKDVENIPDHFANHYCSIQNNILNGKKSNTQNTNNLNDYTSNIFTIPNSNNFGRNLSNNPCYVYSKPPSQVNIELLIKPPQSANILSTIKYGVNMINQQLHQDSQNKSSLNNPHIITLDTQGNNRRDLEIKNYMGACANSRNQSTPNSKTKFASSRISLAEEKSQKGKELNFRHHNYHHPPQIINLTNYSSSNILSPTMTKLRNSAQNSLSNTNINNNKMNVISSISNPNTNLNTRIIYPSSQQVTIGSMGEYRISNPNHQGI